MSPFVLLSAGARALFALWALLLCLGCLADGALAVLGRRYRAAGIAAMLFLPVYVLWQMMFDLRLSFASGSAARISLAAGELPWTLWLAALLLPTLGAALLLIRIVRYGRTTVTPGAVKLFLDRLPCGICCWRSSGRVLFANVCMSRLCEDLTGRPLLNGNQFRDAVKEGILSSGGRVWRFSGRELLLGGERLNELIASDITDTWAKTQALERDGEELAALNRELQDYYQSIDDTVRRQELLQARVTIHDEMNRLMLSTAAAGSGDAEALDSIFLRWEQNALLLGKTAEDRQDATDMLSRLAAALGVRLIWQSPLPETLDGRQRDLFCSAAQEAIVNAVKHGEAKTVTITFAGTKTAPLCRITNDGRPPRCEPRFTGGLANLALVAGEQGASVFVTCDPAFTLSLAFPDGAADISQTADARPPRLG